MSAPHDYYASGRHRQELDLILRGNADLIELGKWTGTPDTADGHDAPLPDSGASEILAGIGLCILVLSAFAGMFLGAAWVHGWRPV